MSRLDCLQLIRGNAEDHVIRSYVGSLCIALERDEEGNFILQATKDKESLGIIAGSGPYLRCMPTTPQICLNGLLPIMIYTQSRTQEFGQHMTINGHMPSIKLASSLFHFKSIMKDMGLQITHPAPIVDFHQQFHVIGLKFFDTFLKFNSKFVQKIASSKNKQSKSVQEARALAINTAHAVQSIIRDNKSHSVCIHADSMQVICLPTEQMSVLELRCKNKPITQFSIRLADKVKKFPVFSLESKDQMGTFAIPVNNSYILVGNLPLSIFRSVSQLCRGDDETPNFSRTYMKICRMLRTIALHYNILRGLRDQYDNIIQCVRNHIKTHSSEMTPWETSNLYYLSGNPDARCHSLWFFHADPKFLSFVKNP